ncbi:CPBP family intramembrane metalloprotease [Saccharothrix sp. AJ9571]|nr:CPBP family intramembrane metalloprotease [Saccharothrix sp. AJ9571]
MAATRIARHLLDAGWCLLVSLGVVAAYLGLGAGVVSVIGEPVLGTVLLGGIVVVLIGGTRFVRPCWFVLVPARRLRREVPCFGWTVVGCSVLAFLAGQSVALWAHTVGGSAGFEETVRTREDAGPAAALVLTLLAAPIAEEMVFRGLLYPLLRRRVGIAASVLVSAGVFSLAHGNVVQFASALPLAVLLALVYERTRLLWPCVILHLGFNLAATVVPAPMLAAFTRPLSTLLLAAAFAGVVLILHRQIRGRPRLAVVDDKRDDDESEAIEPRAAWADRLYSDSTDSGAPRSGPLVCTESPRKRVTGVVRSPGE